MDGGTAPDTGAVSADSTEVFERDVSDRRRLELQFALLREDFDLWFDQTLRLGGLSTDPGRADWSVLDVGCGEGLFTRQRPDCWQPAGNWSPGWGWPAWKRAWNRCCARPASTTSPPKSCATRWAAPPAMGNAGTRTS